MALVAGVSAIAEDEEPATTAAMREQVDRLRLEDAGKAAGTVTCENDSLQGKFEDLVSYFHEDRLGMTYWRVKSEAQACLTASTLSCSSPHILMLKFNSETSTNVNSTVDRWVSNAALGEVMGLDVKMIFYNAGGSWPVCKMDRLIVFR
ncbi:MAG: hypothetical protein AAF560_16490 [Acidobacteriota bacterium]